MPTKSLPSRRDIPGQLGINLDDSHYVRYDFSTATKLLEVSQQLQQGYGTLTHLLAQARTVSELSAKLQEFKHIGPVTARIFCRGLMATRYCPGHLSKSMRRLPRKRKSRRRKHYGITRDQRTARSQG
jgi:hypothetical protein